MFNKNGNNTVYWVGSVPEYCCYSDFSKDFSKNHKRITDSFVDGRLPNNSVWGIYHPTTFYQLGGVLGLGKGQLYQKQENGRWRKIRG